MRTFAIIAGIFCLASAAFADSNPIPLLPDENTLYCTPGQTIRITGAEYTYSGFLNFVITEDGELVDTHPADASTNDSYDFQCTVPTSGTHLLQIKYVLSNGTQMRARRIHVTIIDTAPITVSSAPDQAINDVVITSAAKPSDFTPVQAECFLDGVSVGTGDPKSASFTLPLHKCVPGRHYAYVQVTNALGERYASSPQMITVPERLLPAMPAAITLAQMSDKTPFAVSFAPGVKAVSITYSWGQILPAPPAFARRAGLFGTVLVPVPSQSPPNPVMQALDTTNTAPFNDDIALDQFESGDYLVMASATTDDGTVYQSQAVKVHFRNVERDQKEEADREAAAQAAALAEAAAAAAVLHAMTR